MIYPAQVGAGVAERREPRLRGRWTLKDLFLLDPDRMFLRVSFQAYNTRADADALVEAVRSIYGLGA